MYNLSKHVSLYIILVHELVAKHCSSANVQLKGHDVLDWSNIVNPAWVTDILPRFVRFCRLVQVEALRRPDPLFKQFYPVFK
jgi:hypothetical protein